MANQVSTVQVLLEGSGPGSTKAKVNRVDKRGRSALWLAAELSWHAQAAPMIRLLLSHNAKSIADFDSKRTPLMVAEECGSGEVMRLLQLAERKGTGRAGTAASVKVTQTAHLHRRAAASTHIMRKRMLSVYTAR
jgi:hypothetical protein